MEGQRQASIPTQSHENDPSQFNGRPSPATPGGDSSSRWRLRAARLRPPPAKGTRGSASRASVRLTGRPGKGRRCPDVYARSRPTRYYGCPDRDYDGVADLVDACPNIRGQAGSDPKEERLSRPGRRRLRRRWHPRLARRVSGRSRGAHERPEDVRPPRAGGARFRDRDVFRTPSTSVPTRAVPTSSAIPRTRTTAARTATTTASPTSSTSAPTSPRLLAASTTRTAARTRAASSSRRNNIVILDKIKFKQGPWEDPAGVERPSSTPSRGADAAPRVPPRRGRRARRRARRRPH